jgi:hypothetical protein
MKCIVKDCENHTHQGKFVGELCAPCYEFITEGKGKHSQVFRNTVIAEREWCAKFIEDEYVRDFDKQWRIDLTEAIRARGGKND